MKTPESTEPRAIKLADGSISVAMQYDPIIEQVAFTTDVKAIWAVECEAGRLREVILVHTEDYDEETDIIRHGAPTQRITLEKFGSGASAAQVSTTSYGSVDANVAAKIASLLNASVRVMNDLNATGGFVPNHERLPLSLEVDPATKEYLDADAAEKFLAR